MSEIIVNIIKLQSVLGLTSKELNLEFTSG